MFIGHFGVALGAKKFGPRVSVGTLFAAAQFLDLLWPIFLLLGLEHLRIDPGNTAFTPLDFYDYPLTHSLLTAVGWSALFGGVYFAVRRRGREALVLSAAVLSHWVLDFLTHRPDLPLWPGGARKVGLGLWNSVPATVVVEGSLFVIAVLLYVRSSAARDPTGSYALWSLLGLVTVFWVASIVSPPPPSAAAVAFVALGQWLFVFWFYWIDRHRTLAEI
jgi:hypothetical protein